MRVEGECKCCCAHPSRRGGVRVVPRAGDVHHRRQDAPQRPPTTRRACEAHTVAMRGRWRGADPGGWLVPRPGAVSFPDHDLPLAEAERRCSAPIYTHQRNLEYHAHTHRNRIGFRVRLTSVRTRRGSCALYAGHCAPTMGAPRTL